MECGFYQLDDVGRRYYHPPSPLPAVRIDDVYDDLRMAQKALEGLDRALAMLPDINAIGLLARLEAVESSAAEGTTSTFSELVAHESAQTRNVQSSQEVKNLDVESVMAVVESFSETIGIESRAISPMRGCRLIHGALFPKETAAEWRGYPLGHYKRFPNATNDDDSPSSLFHYARPDSVKTLMMQWQNQTVGREEKTTQEPLIRQALSHWLFEHIHPFADGNGRVGRLLTPIMLWRQGSTIFPCGFYGEPVRQNKADYVSALKEARRRGDLSIWVKYFLFLLSIGASENTRRIQALSNLTDHWKKQLSLYRSDSLVHALLPKVIGTPILGVKNIMQWFPDRSFNTANSALSRYLQLGILEPINAASRDRVFASSAVLDLFDTKRGRR